VRFPFGSDPFRRRYPAAGYFRMPADQWATDSPRHLDAIVNGFHVT
jgi:hypothetical protein